MLVINILTFQPVFYLNKYTNKILFVFILLLISDVLCVLLFSPTSQQLFYIVARMITVVIFLLCLSFRPDLRSLKSLITIFCWSIFMLSLLTIAEGIGLVRLGSNVHAPRTFMDFTIPFYKATGLDMSDGEFGIMVAPAFLYCLVQFFPGSGIKPMKGRLVLTIVTGLALFVSQSRSTWVALLLALTTLVMMIPKGRLAIRALTLTVIAGVALLFTSIYQIILEGMVGEGIYEMNVYNRLASYALSWDYFSSSPLTGVGHGNALHIVGGYDPTVIHSQFLDQVASAGILGIIPLVALYVVFFTSATRLYRDAADGESKGLAVWITASMVHVVVELMFYRGFYSEHLPFFFGLLAMLYSVRYGYRVVTL